MSRPGTYHFIGPLTPAQRERRERAKRRYIEVYEIQDAYYVSFREAPSIHHRKRKYSLHPLLTP